MLRNLINITLRYLNRYRFYTFINVFGLTVGLTACLVILLYVRYELSFDTFHSKADRIYRVDWDLKFGDNSSHRAAVTSPMAQVLVNDYAEIETATRLHSKGSFQWKREIENTVEWRIVYADNAMFDIFTFDFISGNPKFALSEPNTMVITEKCAQQFFPNEDPVGKTLVQDNRTLYKITGVVKDLPENSHFHYRMFLSLEGLKESKNGNWIGGPFNTYVLLRPDADAAALEKKLPGMVEKYLIPHAASVLGSAFMDDFKRGGNTLNLRLFPLLDIHLHSHLEDELEANSDIQYVYMLSSVAIFILVIACINFINLSTARSVKRAREVGIRKVLGSSRRKLAIQFLVESTLLTVVASLLALIAANLVLPLFNLLAGLQLDFPSNEVWIYGVIAATAALVGILSGLYPGIVMASYQPVKVLKGGAIRNNESSFMRSGLVVFQFGVSITLMIGTMALYQQMSFITNRKLGFNKERVILMHDVFNSGDKLNFFREEMLKNNQIINGTISSYFPGPNSARQTPLLWKSGATPSPGNSLNMEKWMVDYDYIPTLGIELSQGRNFSRKFPSDSMAVILNSTAVKQFGFQDDAIGEKLSMFYDNPDGSQDRSRILTWTVIGVMKDFNFESLRQNVSALGLFFGTSNAFIAFRYQGENTNQVVGSLEKQWKKIAPGEPFTYSFLDEKFNQLYSTERKLGKLFIAFSGLAIIIACLGLFALTAFTAEQRSKEIGIRKVMGAATSDVVILLSLNFSKLILYGFLVAAPVAAFGINWFLQQYAYRTDIHVYIYLIAGAVAFLLAFLTMVYQSLQAALANPVDAIKNE